MKNYVVNLLKNAYEFIAPEYARTKRMERLQKLEESGKLAKMCASEIHELFRVRRVSSEF